MTELPRLRSTRFVLLAGFAVSVLVGGVAAVTSSLEHQPSPTDNRASSARALSIPAGFPLPANKQAAVNNIIASNAKYADVPPAPRDRLKPPPETKHEIPPLNDQILTRDIQVPLSTLFFHATSAWGDLTGTILTAVYAGSAPTHSSGSGQWVGALFVVSTILYPESPLKNGAGPLGSGMFRLSGRVGPLTLTSVSGRMVSFTYAGDSGTFDLTSDRFAH